MKIITKRFTLLITIAMLIPALLPAQSFSPGVKVGANLSTISTGLSSSNDWRVGLQAGVFGKIRLNDYTALQPELMYAQKKAGADLQSGPLFRSFGSHKNNNCVSQLFRQIALKLICI
ncbi:MAG: PorT family protein [Bacteroidales bacterium]|nr:PorT family protein [Bacteroidales bacterium]MCF8350378.1 PorT family protein [Bacteroidales bacterium]MCF8375311.1 PorT family protein [Bacteroidales bacterium]MCF8400167.1 PorT family protein [Bacteroidales bacterium]